MVVQGCVEDKEAQVRDRLNGVIAALPESVRGLDRDQLVQGPICEIAAVKGQGFILRYFEVGILKERPPFPSPRSCLMSNGNYLVLFEGVVVAQHRHHGYAGEILAKHLGHVLQVLVDDGEASGSVWEVRAVVASPQDEIWLRLHLLHVLDGGLHQEGRRVTPKVSRRARKTGITVDCIIAVHMQIADVENVEHLLTTETHAEPGQVEEAKPSPFGGRDAQHRGL